MAPRQVLPNKVSFPVSGHGRSKHAFGNKKPASAPGAKRSAISDIAEPPPTKACAAAQNALLAHMHSHPSHHSKTDRVHCAARAMLMLALTAPLHAREAAQGASAARHNLPCTTTNTTHTYLFSHLSTPCGRIYGLFGPGGGQS